MILKNKVKNLKYYLLIGYGVSNKSVYKFLKKRRKKILIYNDKILSKNIRHLQVDLNDINLTKNNILYGIVSAGILPTHEILQILKKNNIKIITDMDLLYLYNKNKNFNSYYVGITGTNGKTTTVKMINNLIGLPHLLGGNIGVGLENGEWIFKNFKKIQCYKKKYRIYILELSSYQLHYIQYIKFNLGVILNIEKNHDEWHGSFEDYKFAKEKLKNSDVFINFSLIYKRNWAFQKETGLVFYKNLFIKNIENSSIYLLKHNRENFLNSLEIITILYKQLGIKKKIPLQNIEKFKFAIYRQQIIYNKENILIINDSKSTNIASTKIGIENYIGRSIILFLGGIIKGDLNLITNYLIYIHHIQIFGSKHEIIKNYLILNNYYKFTVFNSLEDCMNNFKNDLKNKVIIFSPGGASFDEFKDYKHRGLFFSKNILKKIIYI